MDFSVKQVLIMREDLGMSPGKLAAQAAHCAIAAYKIALPKCVKEWNQKGSTKVVLAVDNEHDLLCLYKKAVAAYLPVALIADEGRTEVEPGTITGIGIGPAPNKEIDRITGQLRLYGKEKNNENA